jgi:branched-chain amino acid transport system substrate-binding protein
MPVLGRKTRTTTIAVVLALTLVVAACSSDSKPTGASAGSGSAQPSGKPITVGIITTLTGAAAIYGQAVQQGAEYWASKNTINGQPIKLIVQDDGADASKAVAGVNSLLSDGAQFILGPNLSVAISGVLPVLNDKKILSMPFTSFPAAGDPTQFPYSFRVEWGKGEEAQAIFKIACRQGFTKFATIKVNNANGIALSQGAEDNFKTAPCALQNLGTASFESGATDITAQVGIAKDADFVIPAVSTPQETATVLNGLNDVGFKGKVMGTQALGQQAVIDLIPSNPLVNNLVPLGTTKQVLLPLPPEVQAFRDGLDAFVKSKGAEVIAGPGNQYKAYDALTLLKTAIEKGGSADTESVRKYLESNQVCPPDSIWQCYKYSSTNHNPFVPDAAVPYKAGTEDDGFYQPLTGLK